MIKFLLKFVLPLAAILGIAAWGYFAVVNRQINVNDFFVGDMVRGVDVSSYQEDVNMATLAAQRVEFVYAKATEGSSHVDPTFAEKWAAAREAGVPVGAYHYFLYSESGAAQAENFIKTVGELDGGADVLVPVVDMELTTAEVMNPPEVDDVVRGLKAFAAVVEEKYGVKPMIYSRQDYYLKYLVEDFADYPRWVTNVFFPVWIEVGDGWTVWQYNDCGKLSGYGGEKCIDLNVINKNVGLEGIRLK